MALLSFFADYGIFIILVLLILSPYIFRYLYEKSRDKKFSALAAQYNLKLTLNYKSYSYWQLVRRGETYFLRTLEGSRNGKTMLIQDRLKPLVIISNRVLPVYFWSLFYSGLPTTLFGYGAETIKSVTGTEENISTKGFWSIIAYASPSDIDSLIKSL